jgi:hypothetical protein
MEKIALELVCKNNEPLFLNFWDNKNGKDVCCDIDKGILYLTYYDEIKGELKKEISLQEFLFLVTNNTK